MNDIIQTVHRMIAWKLSSLALRLHGKLFNYAMSLSSFRTTTPLQ